MHPGGSPIDYLNALATFVSGGRSEAHTPVWRVAGLMAGDREGVLLAYGDSEGDAGTTTLARLRDAALQRAQFELSRALSDLEVAAGAKLRELLSWNRHLLGNAFEKLCVRIDAVEAKMGNDPDSKALVKKLWGQCKNLQCLVESATEKKRDTLLDTYRDLNTLLRNLWEWYPCAVNAPIAGECALPDPKCSFEFNLASTRILFMVLTNLLGNAVKGAHPKGKVEMRCSFNRRTNAYELVIENTPETIPLEYAAFIEGRSNTIPTRGKQYRRGLLTVRRLLEDSHLTLPHVKAPLAANCPGTRVTLMIPRRNFVSLEGDDE